MVRVVLFGPKALATLQLANVQAADAVGSSKHPYELIAVDSEQNWGAASTQLVHALMEEHALAVIALDRDSAHLAEQLAIKALVPVIALSGDRSLTSNNVPWIFRLPANTTPAKVLGLLHTALRRSGPNSERLRDLLASGSILDGLAFLPTGEPKIQ
jgi:hypothetical protein